MSLAGTSLIAAIPGGVLAYLMLMAVLNNLDTMPTILKVSAISLLVIASIMALFPIFILIYGPKTAGAAEKKANKKAESQVVETEGGKDGVIIDDTFDDDGEGVIADDTFEDEEFDDGDGVIADDAFEDDDVGEFEDDSFEGSLDETEGEMDAFDDDDEFEFDDFDDDDR